MVTVIDVGALDAAVVRLQATGSHRSARVDEATVESFHAAITRGMGWLDENLPGWEERIEPDALNLGSPCNCILGQCEGDFYQAMEKAGHAQPSPINPDMMMPDFDWASEHGFSVGETLVFEAWDVLTECWKQRLAIREAFASVEAAVTDLVDS